MTGRERTAPALADGDGGVTDGIRLDKWLWHARFCRSRSLATQLCAAGKVRLRGQAVQKAHQAVRPGDVLTFPQGQRIRIVRVVALAARRGPAAEAQRLYEDLSPAMPEARAAGTASVRDPGSGRPTKAERRAVDRLLHRR